MSFAATSGLLKLLNSWCRTDNAVKNHWHNQLKKRTHMGGLKRKAREADEDSEEPAPRRRRSASFKPTQALAQLPAGDCHFPRAPAASPYQAAAGTFLPTQAPAVSHCPTQAAAGSYHPAGGFTALLAGSCDHLSQECAEASASFASPTHPPQAQPLPATDSGKFSAVFLVYLLQTVRSDAYPETKEIKN